MASGRKEATGLGVAWVTKLYVEEVLGKDISDDRCRPGLWQRGQPCGRAHL